MLGSGTPIPAVSVLPPVVSVPPGAVLAGGLLESDGTVVVAVSELLKGSVGSPPPDEAPLDPGLATLALPPEPAPATAASESGSLGHAGRDQVDILMVNLLVCSLLG